MNLITRFVIPTVCGIVAARVVMHFAQKKADANAS